MTVGVRRLARGAGWLYAHRWIERLLDFVSVVVLARLLSPEDFGLVAIAASVATIVEGLAAFDVEKALIRSRDDARELYDTAWTLSLVRGLVAGLVMLAVAPFLGDERITHVVLALAATPVLKGLANPRFVTFERDLDYSKLASLTLAARAGAFVVTVAVAVRTLSHWALVAGLLAGALLTLLLGYVLRPYRPRFSLARFSELFGFSGWLSATSIVTTLSMETDKLIVGRILGIVDAGLYFMTQRVGVLPSRELISPLQRLLYPSFSEALEDPGRLRRMAAESINVLGSLALPAGFGFALVAADFVPLALGGQWTPIVPLLVILVPYLGVRATLSMTLPCVMALGRTRLLFGVSLVYALVHVPAFVLGTLLGGLRGAIGALVGAGVVYTGLNAWMLRRTLGLRIGEIAGRLRRPALATVAMLVVAGPLAVLVPPPEVPRLASWGLLAAKVLLGASSYLGALAWLWTREGRPEGLERRVLELMGRGASPPTDRPG